MTDPTPRGDDFRCGDWPMTLERIRDWQRAFKGAPSRRVPFGAHAVKYLLHLLEEAEDRVEELERKYGNSDPPDAPWIKRPRTGDEWRHRYDPKPPTVGENANPIPDGVYPQDQGTDDYPEWEQYEEKRAEKGYPMTVGDRRDERQLREKGNDGMDLSHLDTPSAAAARHIEKSVAQEQRNQKEEELGDFF